MNKIIHMRNNFTSKKIRKNKTNLYELNKTNNEQN